MNYFIAKQLLSKDSMYYNIYVIEASNETEYKAVGAGRTFNIDQSMWRNDAAYCSGSGGAVNAVKVTNTESRVDITDLIPLVQSSVLIGNGLTTLSDISYNNNGIMSLIRVNSIPTISPSLRGSDRAAAVRASGKAAIAKKLTSEIELTINVNNKIDNIETANGDVITNFPTTISIENGDVITVNAKADPTIIVNYTNTKEPVITDAEGG